MRLAAKWRTSWTIHANGIDQGRIESVRIGSEWVDVVRLGRGDPLVLVPGLAGSWKLLFPLAQMLAVTSMSSSPVCGETVSRGAILRATRGPLVTSVNTPVIWAS